MDWESLPKSTEGISQGPPLTLKALQDATRKIREEVLRQDRMTEDFLSDLEAADIEECDVERFAQAWGYLYQAAENQI